MTDLAISLQEHRFIKEADASPQRRREYLARFWLSRLKKEDPVARIGYALWCKDMEALKKAVAQGSKDYWNHRGYAYWEFMARSTVANLSVGLQKAGFTGNMREKIEEVGVQVAKQHRRAVQIDYRKKLGKVPGLLSLKQMAEYHHQAFDQFNIPPDYYGGTWVQAIPNSWELEMYGHLYCHDCDVAP
ncbi:hypothetical protein [Salicola sp. Rm-C-2C1-2]|uniref:hypothetical protein n=1 Tax=Salicola sp. Rm-C-2C1-2 TaxID=3141321 RepID=UPI0032E3A605